MNHLIILNDPPYGTERCCDGLTLAELATSTMAADRVLVL